MTKDKALKMALKFIERVNRDGWILEDFEPQMYEAITAIKEALETKDEPVATVISESGANVTHSWWHEPALPIGTKLYTTPQRTWVGLTDEEILEIFGHIGTSNSDINVYVLLNDARKIEAKLKEKNDRTL